MVECKGDEWSRSVAKVRFEDKVRVRVVRIR